MNWRFTTSLTTNPPSDLLRSAVFAIAIARCRGATNCCHSLLRSASSISPWCLNEKQTAIKSRSARIPTQASSLKPKSSKLRLATSCIIYSPQDQLMVSALLEGMWHASYQVYLDDNAGQYEMLGRWDDTGVVRRLSSRYQKVAI